MKPSDPRMMPDRFYFIPNHQSILTDCSSCIRGQTMHQQPAPTIATPTRSQIEAIQDMPYDVAWEEGAKLVNVVRTEKNGVTVFTGTHSEHGNIHIIIPAFGDGILLMPFVTHDF
jgi:hypothetical protein